MVRDKHWLNTYCVLPMLSWSRVVAKHMVQNTTLLLNKMKATVHLLHAFVSGAFRGPDLTAAAVLLLSRGGASAAAAAAGSCEVQPPPPCQAQPPPPRQAQEPPAEKIAWKAAAWLPAPLPLHCWV